MDPIYVLKNPGDLFKSTKCPVNKLELITSNTFLKTFLVLLTLVSISILSRSVSFYICKQIILKHSSKKQKVTVAIPTTVYKYTHSLVAQTTHTIIPI